MDKLNYFTSEYNGNEKSYRMDVYKFILLFLFNCLTVVVAGTGLAGKNPFDVSNWQFGYTYAILISVFLLAHEFGHFFAARKHGLQCSYPYFLPMPLPFFFHFGTFGAFIKIRSSIPNRKVLFDVGVSGPIAGFIVCVVTLIIGFVQLPPSEFLYSVHPEYILNGGRIATDGLYFGDSIVFSLGKLLLTDSTAFFPPMNEIYHYPFLCVGWFGLFVTALNLLPFGQLDGGHILYAMIGAKQKTVGYVVLFALLFFGLGGFFSFFSKVVAAPSPNLLYSFLQDFYFTLHSFISSTVPWFFQSWNGWLLWVLIAQFFVKIPHPPVEDETPLDVKRQIVGIFALVMLLISFSYNGIYVIFNDGIERNAIDLLLQ